MLKHITNTPVLERPARAHKQLSPEALAAIECFLAHLDEIEAAQTPEERIAEILATMAEMQQGLMAMTGRAH